jgi:ABC-type glycerol-3-phosphate transport system substrate-binding protein
VALPTAEGKEAPITVSWGSTGLIGFANNGHEEEAKLAIDVWLKTPELRQAALSISGGLSTMNDFVMEYPTEGITATMARAANYGGRCANSSFGIREPWWSDFRETFYVQLQDYYVGNIDGKTLLNNWQTAANTVITAANSK